MRSNDYRCIYCGKYVAYNDIPKKVTVELTPDSEYTSEKCEMWHKKCEDISTQTRTTNRRMK